MKLISYFCPTYFLELYRHNSHLTKLEYRIADYRVMKGGKKRLLTDGAAGGSGTTVVEPPSMSNPVAGVDGDGDAAGEKVVISANLTPEVETGERDLELKDSLEADGEKEEEEEEEDKKGKEVRVNDDEDLPPKLADGFFEIEDIRKKRIVKGQLQYLIKW